MSRLPRLTLILLSMIGLLASSTIRAQAADHPLDHVLRRVRDERAHGRRPIVVFDLDDTLFRAAFRTRKILHDWANLVHPGAAIQARIDALDPAVMPYTLEGTLDLAGIREPALRRSADRFWGRAFFSSHYLDVDQTVRGAVVYVRRLVHEGALVVYLTGRDEPRMGRGTRYALVHAGFPVGESGLLVLKPDAAEKDTEFKERSCPGIATWGPVVASLDNETRNCNMFQRALPGADIVCLDTSHSPGSPPLAPGIRVVRDFFH